MFKWERRKLKKDAEKSRMPKHGQGAAVIYQNAVEKRVAEQAKEE